MNRVLLFANDLVLDGAAPMSGGALRAWGLAEGLRSRGFEVITSVPQTGITRMATKLWDQVPAPLRQTSWNWQNQDAILAQVAPDVVVYSSNPIHLALRQRPRQPLVIDLHGPVMLEDYYIHQRASALDFDLWRQKLTWGDFFITPGLKQKRFFWSWFLHAGIDLAGGRALQVMPVSLGPDLPERPARPAHEPVFVFGGGFFPWTDPSAALSEVVDTIERNQRGQLWAFTDTHQLRAAEAQFQQISRRLLASPRVRFPGFLPRGQLLETYARGDVAVDLMRWNPERELAFTTRTVEYLWCGLPVIYNNYAELAPYIRKYQAGWCLDPDDPSALREVLQSILRDPEMVAQYGRNAQRLAREQFNWETTIEPLARFCRNPQRLAPCPRASESQGLANTQSEKVTPEIVGSGRLAGRFLCQHDHLSSVEVKLATYCRTNTGPIQLRLWHPATGTTLGTRTLDASQIDDNSWVLIEAQRTVSNSAERVIELEITGAESQLGNAISAWASHACPFPWLSLCYDERPLGGALCLKTFHRADAADQIRLAEVEEPTVAAEWVVVNEQPLPAPAGAAPSDCDYVLADWNGDGVPDLWVVKRRGTETGKTELHVFCGRSRFQKPLLQVATPLDEAGEAYSFSVVDWNRDGVPDLVAVKKQQTASGRAEVHVFCGRSRFQKPLLQSTTCLPAEDLASVALNPAGKQGVSQLVAVSQTSSPQIRVVQRVDHSHPPLGPVSWGQTFARARRQLVNRVKASPAGPLLIRARRRLGR